MSEIRTGVSEDGKTWTMEARLVAPGVNEPEKQLSDDEVVAFKTQLKEEDPWLIGRIATHIVMKMRQEDYEHDIEEANERGEKILPFIGEGGEFPTADSYAEWVGHLSVDWALTLKEAMDLPGAEWPEHRATAATYAQALEEVKETESREDG